MAQGVGPPTRISTSPTSLSENTCAKVRPPSSERATWLPLACQATYTVPSERSTATEGSVALVSAEGETCSVKPIRFCAHADCEISESEAKPRRLNKIPSRKLRQRR